MLLSIFPPDIPIGSEENGVSMNAAIFTKIKSMAKCPGQFVLNLLHALFDEETLAASNISGANGKEKLDDTKIKAIKGNYYISTNLKADFLFENKLRSCHNKHS